MKKLLSLLLIIILAVSLSSCLKFESDFKIKKGGPEILIEDLEEQIEDLKEKLKEKEEELKELMDDFISEVPSFDLDPYSDSGDMFADSFDDMKVYELFSEEGLTVYYNSANTDDIGGYLVLSAENRTNIPVLIEAFGITANGLDYDGSYLSKVPSDTNRPLIIFFPRTEYENNGGEEIEKISFRLRVSNALNDEFLYETEILEID
ncbi:MAG: hypothetical protein GX222_05145 [Ruminococcaceae bacterium]|nr:hypothetical protein [Oscillospiraceae bacterium]